MVVVAPCVEAVCPRCEHRVYYDITFSPTDGWGLAPRGRTETPHGPVWLAYRNSLRELVTEAYYYLARTFPKGAKKAEVIRAICEAFDLIPQHAETVLQLIHDEGLLYITRSGEGEIVGWV